MVTIDLHGYHTRGCSHLVNQNREQGQPKTLKLLRKGEPRGQLLRLNRNYAKYLILGADSRAITSHKSFKSGYLLLQRKSFKRCNRSELLGRGKKVICERCSIREGVPTIVFGCRDGSRTKGQVLPNNNWSRYCPVPEPLFLNSRMG